MKPVKRILVYCLLAFVPCIVTAQDMSGMLGQYQKMAEGISKNYPKELEPLLPKGCTVQGKNLVWSETSNMFLIVGMQGARKNDAYPKFGHEAEIKVMVMGYNPATAGFMGMQFPMMVEQMKLGFSQAEAGDTGGYVSEPVTVWNIDGLDVYIQKSVRKNVEIDNRKRQDQVYYHAHAVTMANNMMYQIEILFYPAKPEGLTAMISESFKFFQATDFSKYMK